MKLFLIRHGQTTANAEKFYAGQTDVPLTEQGRREAESIRPILAPIPFDRVYSSDLSRAVHTQQLALPGFKAQTTPLLREFDLGRLVGQPLGTALKDLDAGRRAARDYTVYGGESGDMVCKRLQKFLDGLIADPCENAAAFVHNGIMGCMMQLVLGTQVDITAIRSKNCAIHVFEHDGIKWRLLAWNYMGSI